MQTRIREHIERKFEEAVVEESPFPHLTIRNIFPDDVYERIAQYNPFKENVGVAWQSREESNNVSGATPYFARKQINFHTDQDFSAPDEHQQFWQQIKECFLWSNWFPNLVREKYPIFFRLRFGDLVDDPDFADLFRKELFLQRHEPGYMIGPHTDIPTRVFTCIFSFASVLGFEEYGTQLLAPNERLDRCWGSDHYNPEGFTVRKVAPYAPNSFVLFFKTRQSFHAVKPVDDRVPDQRYGMQFQFYEPGQGLFNDLSTPDLMATRRPKMRRG